MTKQQAFDKMRAWLTRPGARQAFDPTPVRPSTGGEIMAEGVCRYQTEIDGVIQKCAVGCLLSQQDLDRSMATFIGGVEQLFEAYGMPDYILEIGDGNEAEAINFLNRFQAVHDLAVHWTDAGINVEALDDAARGWGLKVPA